MPSRVLGWVVAAMFYLFDVFLRLTVDVVTSKLQVDFNLSAQAISTAFSSSFFYGYAAMQIPVGTLLDQLGPQKTIICASLLSSFGCVLFSFATTTTMGTVARVLSGVGCGCGWLGAVKVTRNSFGQGETRLVRTMFAITCMLGGVGGLISQEPFQWLTNTLGWRLAFRAAAIVPILIAILSFCFVSDVPYQEQNKDTTEVLPGQSTVEDPLLVTLPSSPPFENPSPSAWSALKTCVNTPRMYAYAFFLGGTDAPFETFAGLWGVTFLHQIYGWSNTQAAAATTIVVVLSTVSQLASGSFLGYYTSMKSRFYSMTGLALLGFVSFVPFLLAPLGPAHSPPGGDALGYVSIVSLGLSVASCTIIWSIISSDPLCGAHNQNTGIISGAVNTVCILYDAVIQQLTGVVLGYMWTGQKNSADERVYDALAFSRSFMVLAGSFGLAILSAVFLLITYKRKQVQVEQ